MRPLGIAWDPGTGPFPAISQATHRTVSAAAETMSPMNDTETVQSKISARDRAQRLMNRLTAGIALGAVAGVGALGYVSAATIPGSTSSSATSSTSSTSASSTTPSSSSSSGLQASSGSVSASSSSGVAVSGGS